MDISLFQNPEYKDLLALLVLTNLSAGEKQMWYQMLPYMNREQLEELKSNLKQEIDYEVRISEVVMNRLIADLEAGGDATI